MCLNESRGRDANLKNKPALVNRTTDLTTTGLCHNDEKENDKNILIHKTTSIKTWPRVSPQVSMSGAPW